MHTRLSRSISLSEPPSAYSLRVVIGGWQTLPGGADEVQSASYPTLAAAMGRTMRRREFLALLGGAVAAWPLDVFASVGRRSAIERTAYFFTELAERLNVIGLATEIEFKCPLSQYVLADALGLSAIHINRVLRQLRERDLLTFQGGNVTIHDLNALRKLAGFRGGYLNSRN